MFCSECGAQADGVRANNVGFGGRAFTQSVIDVNGGDVEAGRDCENKECCGVGATGDSAGGSGSRGWKCATGEQRCRNAPVRRHVNVSSVVALVPLTGVLRGDDHLDVPRNERNQQADADDGEKGTEPPVEDHRKHVASVAI